METNYQKILSRLDNLDALRNQIQGMVNLVKFVGWGGLVAITAIALRFFFKGP